MTVEVAHICEWISGKIYISHKYSKLGSYLPFLLFKHFKLIPFVYFDIQKYFLYNYA